MHDNGKSRDTSDPERPLQLANPETETHPLLQQVPLTVSPFIQLPTATTLPYRYKQMPSTLPPSAAGITAASATDDASNNSSAPANKPKYVVSASGYAAHPDNILASCRELHEYVSNLLEKSQKELREFDERIKARELAEKRRVAPGWLDSEARLLEPERKPTEIGASDLQAAGQEVGASRSLEPENKRTETWGYQLQAAGPEVDTGGLAGTGVASPRGPTEGHGHGHGRSMSLQQILNGSSDGRGDSYVQGPSEMAVPDEGEELDRAFGGMQLRKS
jgi:hypothetical protein